MNIVELKKRLEPELLKIPGVVGVGADVENHRLVVYVASEDAISAVESMLQGVPVKFVPVGRVAIIPSKLLEIPGVLAVRVEHGRLIVLVNSEETIPRVKKILKNTPSEIIVSSR